MTDDLRLTNGDLVEMVPVPLGAYVFGPEYIDAMLSWPGGGWSLDAIRNALSATGPWVLPEMPGGREELRERVDPRLRDIVDDIGPRRRSRRR